MSQETNVITLPVAAGPRRVDRQGPVAGAPSAVIDFEAHRKASEDQVQTCETVLQPDQLSPGAVWEAISDDRLVVHYQPQYDMRSGKTVAAEALVRLVAANGHLVYPDCFIDPVEQRDLIVPLGRTVIERVCIDLAACRAQGLPVQRMAINLSAHQLTADTGLLGFIDETLAQHGLQHDDLEYELTERRSLRRSYNGQDILSSLTKRGARVVIDDFGVGYSSVTYLAEMPVAAFKLDRSLVSRVPEDGRAAKLIGSLLALADNMGLDVVAEGVETTEQRNYLTAAGCPFAQGYGYARPMPVDLFKELVAKENRSGEAAGLGR